MLQFSNQASHINIRLRVITTMDKKYVRIICLIAKHSMVNLNDCRIYCPDVSSETFYNVLRILEKNGLVEKKAEAGNLVTYRKTKEFTIIKAVEAVKANNKDSYRDNNKTISHCEAILKAVNSVVDPASGLTFAEMGVKIIVKEEKQGFVHIEFSPPFCPLATEFTTYINTAIRHISGLKKVCIRCGGQLCTQETDGETNIGQLKLTTPKNLLDYMS